MATVVDIVRKKRGKAGSNGSWRVEGGTRDFSATYELWHYGTRMLEWYYGAHTDYWNFDKVCVIDVSLGHGSVSDQQAMNRVFRELDIPWYFSRAGGAEIKNYKTGEVIL